LVIDGPIKDEHRSKGVAFPIGLAVGLGLLAIIFIGLGIVALIRRLRHKNDVHSCPENGDSEPSSSHQTIQKTMRANRANLPSLKDCFPSSKGTHARNLKKSKPGRRNQTLRLTEEMEHKKHGGVMDNPLHKNHAPKWDADKYETGSNTRKAAWDANEYATGSTANKTSWDTSAYEMGDGKPNQWSSEYESAVVHKARHHQTTLFSIPIQGAETSEGTSGYVTVETQNKDGSTHAYDEVPPALKPRGSATRGFNSAC